MTPGRFFDLCKRAVNAWMDDFAPSMGAAIAYYTAFSLAPLLVIVIAIAGAVFGREAVTGQITAQLAGLIGMDGARVVQGLVASASDTERGLVAGLISVVVLLVGATTVFAELQSALDDWNAGRFAPVRPGSPAEPLPAPSLSGARVRASGQA